jgi:hypothetical protein
MILIENLLLKETGKRFEDLFVAFAKQQWGGHFEAWKPHGRFGDFKCDGYLVPEGTVFQSHGPEQPNASTTASKIREDFEGAKAHFNADLRKWVFVYNQPEIPAPCGELLRQLRQVNPDIEIELWLRQDVYEFALNLGSDKLAHLFPQLFAGAELSDTLRKALRKITDERDATSDLLAIAAGNSQHNRPALYEALDNMGNDDREIRMRLLAYSKWLDPLTIERCFELFGQRRINIRYVQNNMDRLNDLKFIKVTERHILPLNEEVCSEAAAELSDEFIQVLSAG